MTSLFFILLFISLAGMVAGAIRPSLFAFLLKGRATRKTLLLTFGILSAGFFVVLGLLPATKNIQEIDAITKRPVTDEEWTQGIVFQGALAEVSLRYIEAAVYTDTLFRNVQKLSDEERIALLDQTIQKWAEAKLAAEQFSAVAEFQPDYVDSVSYKNSDSRFSLIKIEKALAATVEDDIDVEEEIDRAWRKKKELGEEKLLQLIDMAPPGHRVKEAAKIFGTSIGVADVVLQDLRADVTKKYLKEAAKYDRYSKAAQTIQAGAKVAVFVGGVVAGGGLVTVAGKAAHIVISSVAGAELTMEVSGTAVNVGIADKEGGVAAIAKAKEAQFFKKMTLVVGITDVAKALGQFGKVVEAAGGLKNLLTADGLKKIIGNTELTKGMKADASGNLQTIIAPGPAVWDFLMGNPKVTTVVLDTATPGKVVLAGINKTVAAKELPTAKVISGFIKAIYTKAASAVVVPQETPASAVVVPQETPASTVVVPQETPALEKEVLTLTEIPEEIRIDADSSWEGILKSASTLSLRARCAFKTAAGGNYPLEIYVNGQPVTTPLLNKKMSFTYKDGRTFSYQGGASGQAWLLFYIPQMGLNNLPAAGRYQVMTDPGQANNYKWSVSSYLGGDSYIKVRLRNNGACLGHQIVIRGLSTQ